MPPRLAAAATAAARALAAAVALGWLAWLAIGGRSVLAGAAAALASAPAIAIVAAALAAGAALARAGHAPARLLERVPPRAFGAAVLAIALASGLWAHEAVHKGVPEVPDELGYLHQARTFADGHLVAPSPPVPEHHYVSWGTHDASGWYAVFPPGYAALLALGELAGAPGAVNPLLGALLALVVWLLARELFGGDTAAARAAALLHLGSWFRLMNAGSFMSHPAAALFGALAVLGLWRGVVRPRPGDRARAWAAAGGAALACLGATRPLDAILVAAALAPALGWALARDRAPAARRLALAALCALPIAAAYLAYNRALTGDALLPPQQRYMQLKERRGDCFRLGFGPGVGECPITQNTSFGPDGFQPRHAVANTHRRLEAWSRWSFGWAPLALLPIAGLLGAALRGGAIARRRALCGGVLAATAAGYALFFYHGVAYGARFYYLALPFAGLLGAAGCADLGAALARRGRRGALAAGALGLALPAVIGVGMWRDRAAVEEHCGRRPALADGALARRLAEPSLAHALVFVDSMKVPAAVTAHPAELERNRPLVVKDLGDAANAGFARLYPDRQPMRLAAGGRLVPLAYAPAAPMRHEGGALYPLERAAGGFGRRVPSAQAGGLPLSAGEALRFDADGPARFAFPVWAHAADAGPMTLALRLAHHPRGAAIAVRVDGAAAPALAAHDTAAPAWALATVELPVVLAPGRHWVELELPAARPGQAVVLDYAELRPRR